MGEADAQESGGIGLNMGQSNRVAIVMEQQFKECHSAELVYRPDCYRDAFRAGASKIKNNAAYWEAEDALMGVGRKIYKYVNANRDPNASTSGFFGSGHKAIVKSKLPEAEREISKWMSEAVEVLEGGSKAEVRYFAPIAEVVDKIQQYQIGI